MTETELSKHILYKTVQNDRVYARILYEYNILRNMQVHHIPNWIPNALSDKFGNFGKQEIIKCITSIMESVVITFCIWEHPFTK